MAAIIITLVTMVVISLIVLGFATVSRREQRQNLDQQLSTQAFYAAESAVEDAKSVIQKTIADGKAPAGKTDCTKDDQGGGYPTGTQMVLDSANQVSYTCLKVDLSPNSLAYDGVGDNGVVVPVNIPNPLDRIEITWKPNAGSAVGGSPSASCPKGTDHVFAPQSGAGSWSCGYGVLRVDAVKTDGALTRAGLIGSQFTGFFVPTRNGASGTASYSARTPATNCAAGSPCFSQPSIVAASCDTAAYTQCKAVINNFNGDGYDHTLRISSLYRTSDITLAAWSTSNNQFPIQDTQAVIDATGKAQDVLRRIQVRVPLVGQQLTPSYALRSNGSICKRFSTTPTYFNIDPTQIAGPDPGNQMCSKAVTDGSP